MRYIEKKKLPFSKAPQDDRNLPDVHLGLYDDVIVFDHVEKVSHLFTLKSKHIDLLSHIHSSVGFISFFGLYIIPRKHM